MGQNSSDKTGLIATSDYSLLTLNIVTSDGKIVDVKKIMVELDIYEDIFSVAMTGHMVMGDSLDLISSYGFHGNEFLQVSIDKPSLGIPLVKTFRIFKISDRSLGSNGLQNYTMHFCSEELFLSTQSLISKSYKGLRIDQMVSDLLMGKLKINPNKIFQIEPTSGNFDLIIPRMSAFEAISWLTPRAINTNRNLYFFFENRDGFNFVSYETLLSNQIYKTYSYNIKLSQSPEHNSDTFNMLNVTQDFDMIKASRSGAYSSTIATLDIVNRQFSALNFNSKQLANNATLNGNNPSNDLPTRLGQSVYQTGGNMIKFVITTDSDPTFNPANIKKWLPQTTSRLGQLNTFKIAGSISGDILVKAGMVVGLNVQKMEIQAKVTANDPIRSGRYLVSSVHHKFRQDISATVVELLSDSVSAQYALSANTSQLIQQVLNS